jgi:superfamily II DNA helicase RecQ
MESKKWLDSADVDPNHLRAHYILRALNVARAMYSIKLHDWQAAAIADVLMHRDVVVSAGTGSGKSIIFQTLPYTVQNGIILVVSPLLSIMYDQASNHVNLHGILVARAHTCTYN